MSAQDYDTKYFAIMTCRNSEETIKGAILAMHAQTIRPVKVIVIDDGSTDKTAEILQEVKEQLPGFIDVITKPDRGYDITRIAANWNDALEFAELHGLVDKCRYHIITTDDIRPEPAYCEKLLKYLQEHTNTAILSGDYGNKRFVSPHGAGRMVDNLAFNTMYRPFRYPVIMGHESAVLYQAKRFGYDYAITQEARYDHIRPLGDKHNFATFGASMRAMGYHPLFVFGRFAVYFLAGKPIGRKGAINMLYHYFKYKPTGGYYGLYDNDFRAWVRAQQLKKLKGIRLRRLRNYFYRVKA